MYEYEYEYEYAYAYAYKYVLEGTDQLRRRRNKPAAYRTALRADAARRSEGAAPRDRPFRVRRPSPLTYTHHPLLRPPTLRGLPRKSNSSAEAARWCSGKQWQRFRRRVWRR